MFKIRYGKVHFSDFLVFDFNCLKINTRLNFDRKSLFYNGKKMTED